MIILHEAIDTYPSEIALFLYNSYILNVSARGLIIYLGIYSLARFLYFLVSFTYLEWINSVVFVKNIKMFAFYSSYPCADIHSQCSSGVKVFWKLPKSQNGSNKDGATKMCYLPMCCLTCSTIISLITFKMRWRMTLIWHMQVIIFTKSTITLMKILPK